MADTVARHLVAAGQVIDEDSELALQHAIAARRIASRIAVVREAVGLAAYAAGDWATTIAELRTYHRMSGKQSHLAEIADSERALGRPERAIDLFRGADRESLEKAGAIELLIVAAGARGDLGQHDAAVAMLQVRELTTEEDAEWAARLRYAYADALLAAGRRDEAREWFVRAAASDTDDMTDAAERVLELDGVTIEGDDLEEEDDDATALAAEGDSNADADGDDDATALADEDEGDDADDDAEDVATATVPDVDDVAGAGDGLDVPAADGDAAEVATKSVADVDDAAGVKRDNADAADVATASVSDVDDLSGAADDERDNAQFQADAFVDDQPESDGGSPAEEDTLVADVDADDKADDKADEKAGGDEFVVEGDGKGAERRPEA
jgi:tetratricopeptide (TPR) repeat protein